MLPKQGIVAFVYRAQKERGEKGASGKRVPQAVAAVASVGGDPRELADL